MQQENTSKRVLMVVTNPTKNLQGWPVGFWGCELSHPYFEFTSAGYEVDIVSPDGGKLELDAGSDPRNKEGFETKDILTMGLLHMPELAAQLESSRKLSEVDIASYEAMMVCGGQASIQTFRNDKRLSKAIRQVVESGGLLVALCYGVSALLDVRLSNGEYLLAGKTVTGFTNAEEDILQASIKVAINPFRIQDAAAERGATFVSGAPFAAYAHRDGRLITGQQKFSSRVTAQLALTALASVRGAERNAVARCDASAPT